MLLNNYNQNDYHYLSRSYPSESPINSPESRWMYIFDRLQIKYCYGPQIDLPDGTLFTFSKFYLPELAIWVGIEKEFSRKEKEKLKYLYNQYISKDIIIVDDIPKDIFANLNDIFFKESKLAKDYKIYDKYKYDVNNHSYKIFDIIFSGSIFSLKKININKKKRQKVFIPFSDHSGFSSIYNNTYEYWIYRFSSNNFSVPKTKNYYSPFSSYFYYLKVYSHIRHYINITEYNEFKIFTADFIDYIFNNKIESSDSIKYLYRKVKCGKNEEYSLEYIEKNNYTWKSIPIS